MVIFNLYYAKISQTESNTTTVSGYY